MEDIQSMNQNDTSASRSIKFKAQTLHGVWSKQQRGDMCIVYSKSIGRRTS